jgi:hypothetical protein
MFDRWVRVAIADAPDSRPVVTVDLYSGAIDDLADQAD